MANWQTAIMLDRGPSILMLGITTSETKFRKDSIVEKIHNKHRPEIQNGYIEQAVELLHAENRSREDVESTPNPDINNGVMDGNPKPNMVGGLVALNHGVGSMHGVAVGLVSDDVAYLEVPQPLITKNVHHPDSYTWKKHSTDKGKFQRVSENI
jgi:hypothetical protein